MTLLARARERRATIAVCAGVTLLATLLAFWWSTTNRYRLTGDEPHYLILAASLLRDGDVDVRNNFDEDATGEIYGPIPDRHLVSRDGREYLHHAPGLSALLTLPFALGGPTAARLLLCLLIIPILGWACWRWLNGRAPPGDVALAIAGLLLCPVVLFGSGQVYGDLLAGAVLLALAVWLWNGETSTPSRRGRSGGSSRGGFIPGCTSGSSRPPRCSACLAPGRSGAIGLGSMKTTAADTSPGCTAGWCSSLAPVRSSGSSLQRLRRSVRARLSKYDKRRLPPRSSSSEGTSISRTASSWHAAALLPRPVALGWMAYRKASADNPLAVALRLAASRQAVRDHWGGVPIGRFNWASMWLWLIPIGLWLEAERATTGRYVRPACGCPRVPGDPGVSLDPGSDPPFHTRLRLWSGRATPFPWRVRYTLPHFYLDTGDSWWVCATWSTCLT